MAALAIGRMNGPLTFMIVAAAAVAGAYLVGKVGEPTSLGKLYCYAKATTHGAIYQSQCRDMNTIGYVRATEQGEISMSKSPSIIAAAFTLVADARGNLMAVCGVTAGLAGGYLLRRANN